MSTRRWHTKNTSTKVHYNLLTEPLSRDNWGNAAMTLDKTISYVGRRVRAAWRQEKGKP